MTIHINNLEQLVKELVDELPNKKRVVVAIAGVPGAGKSTLVEKLMVRLQAQGIKSKLLPQDGFHYYREQLAKFQDPEEAFRRRGAPFTFDAERFVSMVKQVYHGDSVKAPLFDHSKKDPQEGQIEINGEDQIIFIEGNYVGLQDSPWNQLLEVSDVLWFIKGDSNLVRERLIQRHLLSGVCATYTEAVERCDGLDWKNALYVVENTRTPDVIIGDYE